MKLDQKQENEAVPKKKKHWTKQYAPLIALVSNLTWAATSAVLQTFFLMEMHFPWHLSPWSAAQVETSSTDKVCVS